MAQHIESKTSVIMQAFRNALVNVRLVADIDDDDLDEPEPTPRFVSCVVAAHEEAERHLETFKDIVAPFTPPSIEDYVRYWINAPHHHFTQKTGCDQALSEMTWLTVSQCRACAEPTNINRNVAMTADLVQTAAAADHFRRSWSIQPLPDEKSYLKLRDVYTSMLIWLIPYGVVALLGNGVLKVPVIPPRPPKKTKEPKEGKDEAKVEIKNNNDNDDDEDQEEEDEESRIAREAAIGRFNTTVAVEQWLQKGAQLFPFVDAVFLLVNRFPVVALVPTEEHSALEAKFAAWVTHRSQYTLTEEFRTAVFKLACRLALPIGSTQRASRDPMAPPPSYDEFYRSEYGDQAYEEMDALGMKKHEEVYMTRFDSSNRGRYLKDAIAIGNYRQSFSNQVRREYDWEKEHFVDSAGLQHCLCDMLTKRFTGGGSIRRVQRTLYKVVHLADSYHVFNGTNLVRCSSVVQALWWWTHCLEKDFASTLDNQMNVKERWIDSLFKSK
jgi:hypothetical protein